MPSRNFTPSITLESHWNPRSRRQLRCAHREHCVSRQATLGALGPVAHGGESRFDGVARTKVGPVLGRKVLKSEQFGPILCQTLARLGVLGTEAGNEMIEGTVRIGLDLGHPDLVQPCFSLGLQGAWQVVEHVHRLMLS